MAPQILLIMKLEKLGITDIYRQVSNIRRNFVGNKIVDNLDVVGA